MTGAIEAGGLASGADFAAIKGPESLRQHPYRLSAFRLLWIFLFVAMLAPPLVPGSAIRLDTIAIFAVPLLVVLGPARIAFDRRSRPVVIAFGLLAAGIGGALLSQAILLGKPYVPQYLQNLQGHVRPLLFALLAAAAIRTARQAESIVKLVLFGIIVHGVFAIIEYCNLQPFTAILNLLYRGDVNARVGLRAVGAFHMVHDLAYFNLCALIFSLAISQCPAAGPSLRKWARAAAVFAFIGLLLPFSRSSWISALGGIGFMLLRRENLRLGVRLAVVLAFCFAAGTALFPSVLETVQDYGSSIVDGARYLLGAADGIDESKIFFITNRLDWGWMNSLQVWKEHPLHGDMSYAVLHFAGDGGYTETLGNHGLLGIAAYTGLFLALWRGPAVSLYARKEDAVWVTRTLRAVVVAFLFALFATAILKERSTEMLPVILVSLVMLPEGRTRTP